MLCEDSIVALKIGEAWMHVSPQTTFYSPGFDQSTVSSATFTSQTLSSVYYFTSGSARLDC